MTEAALTERALEELAELYAHLAHFGDRNDPYPLTQTERLALVELALHGPLRMNDLAERIRATPATVSRSLDTLEHFGLAERKASKVDRRGITAAATQNGRRWVTRRRRAYLKALSVQPLPKRLVDLLAQLNAELRGAAGTSDGRTQLLLASASDPARPSGRSA